MKMNEITYTHKLSQDSDGVMQCNCSESFTTILEAADHFIVTTERAVRNQTGWRGLLGRITRDDVLFIIRIVAAVLTAIAILVMTHGMVAHADPGDPSPYQIGQNPLLPGLQTYQPHCADVPISCGFSYHPDNGTWQRNGDE